MTEMLRKDFTRKRLFSYSDYFRDIAVVIYYVLSAMSADIFLATTLTRYSAPLLRHSVKMAELLNCAIG